MARQFMPVSRRSRNTGAFLATVGSLLVLAFVVGGLLQRIPVSGAQVTQKTTQVPQKTPVDWSAEASNDLEVAYHKLHDAWNVMDVAALKQQIVGDDVLATFDLDPDTNEPIKLTSKADINRFTDKLFDGFKNSHIKSIAEHPMIRCRATSTLGICTEECKVQMFLPDGGKQIQRLRATAVAAKYPEGWRFIQWHMSQAGAPLNYDKQGNLVETPKSSAANTGSKN